MMTTTNGTFHVGGVFPHLSVRAEPYPRSEVGTGALLPWAGKLWFVTYVSHMAPTGKGAGLYVIDDNLTLQKHPESMDGTYANRLLHGPSNQAIVGPHLIDVQGNVRTIREFSEHRLAATMMHLDDPDNKVYFLTMEGLFYEANVHTLELTLLYDLLKELDIPADARPHFKAGFTNREHRKVVVTNNSYYEEDVLGQWQSGRLAEWDGQTWTILERKPFNEVHGRLNFGGNIFATGWDKASAILKVFNQGQWKTYRLPKASQCFEHAWQTEWPRIREVEHERFLMDASGMFYEMSPVMFGGQLNGVRPVCTHLRVVPDFCVYKGMLVLGGDQATPTNDANLLSGEPHAGLWMGNIDELWRFGKPAGWGGPWQESAIQAGQPSDPFLMYGFEHKVLHLYTESAYAVNFKVEVDLLGKGIWKPYTTLTVAPNGYTHHEFPAGFSAQWVRLTADADCTATAHFIYG